MGTSTADSFAAQRKAGRMLILSLVVLVVCAALLLGPTLAEPGDYLGYALRVTAWISFSFFITAYVAGPLRKVLSGPSWLVVNRRYLGLAAAFAHTVHFGYVAEYVRTTSEVVELATYIGGGLAFVLFWLMALTSNDLSVRWLGSGWKILHRFGMHYIWFVFALTFSGGLGVDWVSTLFFVGCVLALMLRLWAWRRGSAPAVS